MAARGDRPDGSVPLSLGMEGRERFIHLPVELDPLVAQAFAAPERTLTRDADLRHTLGARRRLDAGDDFREFSFEIVEIVQ
jgi:hypothetical protein